MWMCPYCRGRKTFKYDGASVKCICSIGHGPARGGCRVHLPLHWLETHSVGEPPPRWACRNGPRPCPHIWTCKHHLYGERISDTVVKIAFPHLRLRQLKETCALDIAERGGATLEEVGDLLNLTRERVRQIEIIGLRKLRGGLQDYIDDDE